MLLRPSQGGMEPELLSKDNQVALTQMSSEVLLSEGMWAGAKRGP